MRSDTLTIPLLSSCAIHIALILLGSAVVHNSDLRRQNFLPISLVDLPRTENPAPPRSLKVEQPKEIKPVAKTEVATAEQPAPLAAPTKEDPAKSVEIKPAVPAKTETAPSFASGPRFEDGGSEAGAGNLFGKGDVGAVPGAGTAGGGGGTAASGLGRDSGSPGLPTQQTILKTNREAKPIQTVRAAYPAMALRMGIESDVTLKIEVDTEGKVIKAEVTKSGGAGFDEEALKAVKQFRFEPAQRDGQNIPAEFTYVYRFRLQR